VRVDRISAERCAGVSRVRWTTRSSAPRVVKSAPTRTGGATCQLRRRRSRWHRSARWYRRVQSKQHEGLVTPPTESENAPSATRAAEMNGVRGNSTRPMAEHGSQELEGNAGYDLHHRAPAKGRHALVIRWPQRYATGWGDSSWLRSCSCRERHKQHRVEPPAETSMSGIDWVCRTGR